MRKLTIEDIRDPNSTSGYRGVSNSGGSKPWRASVGAKPHWPGEKTAWWRGPRRATPDEAAQDYCNHVNGGNVKQSPKLKSAGHKVDPRPRSQRTKRSPRQLAKEGTLYLVTDGEYVKIGWTRRPINERLKDMQTGNARILKVLGMKPGTLGDEGALHQKYIKLNVLQEWFMLSDEMLKEFTT